MSAKKTTKTAVSTTTAAATTKMMARLSAKTKAAKKGGKPIGYVAEDTTTDTVKVWRNKNREGDEFTIPAGERFSTPLYVTTLSPKTTVKEVADAVKGIVNDTTITTTVKSIGKMVDGRTLFGVLLTTPDKGDEADICLAFAKDAVIHGIYSTKLLTPVKDGMTAPTDKCPSKGKEVKPPKFEEPATETQTEATTAETTTKETPMRTIDEVEEEISNLEDNMDTDAAKAASAIYNTFSKKVRDAETRTAFAKTELESFEKNRADKVEEVTIAIVNLGIASEMAVSMAIAALDKEFDSLKEKVVSAEEAEAAIKAERRAAADAAYDAYLTEARARMTTLEEELEKLQHEASLKAIPAALAALGLSEAAIKAALAAESQN